MIIYVCIYICFYVQKIAKFSHIPLRMSDFSTRCRALGVEDLVKQIVTWKRPWVLMIQKSGVHSPVEVGSLSHHLEVVYIPAG